MLLDQLGQLRPSWAERSVFQDWRLVLQNVEFLLNFRASAFSNHILLIFNVATFRSESVVSMVQNWINCFIDVLLNDYIFEAQTYIFFSDDVLTCIIFNSLMNRRTLIHDSYSSMRCLRFIDLKILHTNQE